MVSSEDYRRGTPSLIATVLMVGVILSTVVIGGAYAAGLIEPIRDPVPQTQLGFEPTGSRLPAGDSVDERNDVLVLYHNSGDRLVASEVRLVVEHRGQTVTWSGAAAYRPEDVLEAGEVVVVHLGEPAAAVWWGEGTSRTTTRPPTWTDATEGDTIDIRAGDTVRVRVVFRETNATIASVRATA